MISPGERPDYLQLGIEQAQKGDKAEARALFEKLAEAEPGHRTVWLWLASVAQDAEMSTTYLERALAADPANRQARQWLDRLQTRPSSPTAAWRCPLCSQSFTARQPRCTRCRAELSLARIEIFLRPGRPAVDRDRIEQTLDRALAQSGPASAERHRVLALAYLNLGQPQKALSRLGALAALAPEDDEVARAVDRLTEYLERRQGARPTVPAMPPMPKQTQTTGVETTELDAEAVRRVIASPTARRPTILVVDDSPTVRHLLQQTLTGRGYRIVLAANGMEALARLQETVPNLVLLDVTMPHLDGFKICRVIKDNDLTAHVPVVFLSGKDGFLDKVRGRMAGAVDYLAKPVSRETLLEVVDRHCDGWITDDSWSGDDS